MSEILRPYVFKCERQLEWIRNQPCCDCGKPPRNDPHHVLGTSRDDVTVPKCRICHDKSKKRDPIDLKKARKYRAMFLKERGGKMYYSTYCPYCKEQIVVEANDEEEAKFLGNYYRNCGCATEFCILPEKAADGSRKSMYDTADKVE